VRKTAERNLLAAASSAFISICLCSWPCADNRHPYAFSCFCARFGASFFHDAFIAIFLARCMPSIVTLTPLR
jgi:hypothetical protein